MRSKVRFWETDLSRWSSRKSINSKSTFLVKVQGTGSSADIMGNFSQLEL